MDIEEIKKVFESEPDKWVVCFKYCGIEDVTNRDWMKLLSKPSWADDVEYKLIAKYHETIADAIIADPDVEIQKYTNHGTYPYYWQDYDYQDWFENYDYEDTYRLKPQKQIKQICDNPDVNSLSRSEQKIDEDYGGLNNIIPKGLKYDADKLLMSLVDPEYIEDVASVLTFGAAKYEPNSWQHVEDAERRYKDALLRHTMSYLKGEHLDSESGLTHLSHMATNIMFLSHFSREANNVKI